MPPSRRSRKKSKDARAALKEKTTELELKLELKRLGAEGFTDENRELIRQVDKQMAELDADNKPDKKKIIALQKRQGSPAGTH